MENRNCEFRVECAMKLGKQYLAAPLKAWPLTEHVDKLYFMNIKNYSSSKIVGKWKDKLQTGADILKADIFENRKRTCI